MVKVLLIDDDKAVNYFNKHIISRHMSFSHIQTMQSGEEALLYLTEAAQGKQLIPDVIFLDINMPAMNGWEFLDRFEKMSDDFRKKIKVIILSSSSNPSHINKSMESYNVVDFINKPLSHKILDAVFENHSSILKGNNL